MTCGGYNAEAYSLYVLGLGDDGDAEEIGTHLRQGCDTCLGRVRRSGAEWTAYAVGEVRASGLKSPSAGLKRRIVLGVSAGRHPWFVWKFLSLAEYATTAALIIGVGVGASYFTSQRALVPAPAPAPVAIVQPRQTAPPAPAVSPAIEQENQRLRQELAALRETLGRSPSADAGVRAALAQAQTSLRDTEQALAAERARASALDAQVGDQRTQLAAAQADVARERQQLQARTQASAADRARLEERDRQIADYQGRLENLERENARVRDVMQRQQQQLDRSTRLVALLNSPTLRFVKLAGSDRAAEAHAFVAEGNKIVFSATGLRPLPAGRTYQLWLLRDSGPPVVSGGIFQMSTGQTTTFEFTDAALIRGLRGLAITEEPAQGSVLPTGPKLLTGTVGRS